MAIVLGSCGCGCGSTCKTVENNCTLTLRRYVYTDVEPSWNANATDADKECYTVYGGYCGSGDQSVTSIVGSLSYCTGEGILYRVITKSIFNPDTNGVETSEQRTEIGTFNTPYQDENIAWENIIEEELTDEEKNQKNPPCKFSYTFNFTPDDNATYLIFSKPCQDTLSPTSVNLTPEGKAYFLSYYNETTKKCDVFPANVLVFPG